MTTWESILLGSVSRIIAGMFDIEKRFITPPR